MKRALSFLAIFFVLAMSLPFALAAGSETLVSNTDSSGAAVVSGSTDVSGDTATTSVSDSEISDAITKAVEVASAKKTPTTSNASVAIKEAASAANSKTSVVTLSAKAAKDVQSNGLGIDISTTNGSVSFSNEVLDVINAKADTLSDSASVRVELQTYTGKAKVPAEEQTGANVVEIDGKVITISVYAGDNKISDFGNSEVMLNVPVAAGENYTLGRSYEVVHIDSAGRREILIGTCMKDPVTQQLYIVFRTKSFSTFVITGLLPDVTSPAAAEAADSNGSMNYAPVLSAVFAAAAVCVLIMGRRKRS